MATSESGSSLRTSVTLQRYIYLSTLIGVFSEMLAIHVGATLFFFYFVMALNLLLIWAFLRPVIFPKWLRWFLLYLAASGAIGIWRGTDTLLLVSKQFFAIGLNSLYFANFFDLQGHRINRVWETYAKLSYFFTLAGFPVWLIQCLNEHAFVRLQGIFTEPAAYCLLTLPALYWYTYQWIHNGKHRREVLWMSLGIMLSLSSLGYVTLAAGLLLMFGKRLFVLPVVAGLILALSAGLYTVSSEVRLRVDDTFSALANSDVSGTNISTYALISNLFVTEHVLAVHPILGNGLGSHIQSNAKYIDDVPGVDIVEAAGWDTGANVQDAASMTLRSLSEQGIVGFLGILWFIFYFRVPGNSPRAAMCSAVLLVFIHKMLRGGGYSNPEQFFFIIFYMVNYREYKLETAARVVSRIALSPIRPDHRVRPSSLPSSHAI
jgi:hypothetical protein